MWRAPISAQEQRSQPFLTMMLTNDTVKERNSTGTFNINHFWFQTFMASIKLGLSPSAILPSATTIKPSTRYPQTYFQSNPNPRTYFLPQKPFTMKTTSLVSLVVLTLSSFTFAAPATEAVPCCQYCDKTTNTCFNACSSWQCTQNCLNQSVCCVLLSDDEF